jgi:hypothetical protein
MDLNNITTAVEADKIISIRESFSRMTSRMDLLHLMNEVKPLVYGKDCHPFKMNQLTWFANPKQPKKRYKAFAIRKKSGNYRSIHAPVEGLKAIQKVLSVILQCVADTHPASMGFVWNRSIVTNAKLHVGARYVFNIDLKDFFPSIDQARVWKCLQIHPFNLINHQTSEKQSTEDIDYERFFVLPRIDKENTSIPHEINFSIKGKDFIVGKKSIKLKSGELVYFEVEKRKDNEGYDVDIFLWRSSYDIVKDFVKREIKHEDNEFDLFTFHVLARIVTNSIVKASALDHRGILANLIASLCCTEMDVERKSETGDWNIVRKNVIPQGAPTSPVITNIICRKLDHRLTGVAKRFGLRYSRYADDITFSSMHNVYQENGDFLTEMHRIITEQGFHIQQRKTRLQKDGFRKEVTGLLVHDKVNVPRKFVKELRMWLYMWEKYGIEKASNIFISDYVRKHGVIEGNIHMPNIIKGKLNYLSMVKGKDDPTVLALLSRFEELIQKDDIVEKLISQWETDGIEVAMKNYLDDTRND